MLDAGSHEFVDHFTALIKALADEPDLVKVTLVQSADDSQLIEVRASKREVGRIIGVNGRTARALRTLLAAAGMARSVRYVLDIQAS